MATDAILSEMKWHKSEFSWLKAVLDRTSGQMGAAAME
jgi:hypothetical protein